jgi:hypothetical protein
MNIKMRIKNIGMFTLVTLFFLAIFMTPFLMNTVYQISYIDMKEVVLIVVISFFVYTGYFIRSVYVSGIKRR